jgi:hypothetical protein
MYDNKRKFRNRINILITHAVEYIILVKIPDTIISTLGYIVQ